MNDMEWAHYYGEHDKRVNDEVDRRRAALPKVEHA